MSGWASQDLIIVGNNLPRCPLELPGVYPGRAGHTERSSTLEFELADIMAANGGAVSLLDVRDMTRHCNVSLLVHLREIVDCFRGLLNIQGHHKTARDKKQGRYYYQQLLQTFA